MTSQPDMLEQTVKENVDKSHCIQIQKFNALQERIRWKEKPQTRTKCLQHIYQTGGDMRSL